MSDEQRAKEKLLNLLEAASEKAVKQAKIGKAIQESAQQVSEIIAPVREMVLGVPEISPEELAHQASV